MSVRSLSDTDIDEMDVEQLRLAYAFSVASAERRWKSRFAERVRPSGHTSPRMVALYALADAPRGLTQVELAELLDVSSSTLVGLLDTMEGRGMISRRVVAGDRRINRVFIEDQGRRDLAEMEIAARALGDEIFADIPEDELRGSLKIVRRMAERLIAKTKP